jgi:hypothetical protein
VTAYVNNLTQSEPKIAEAIGGPEAVRRIQDAEKSRQARSKLFDDARTRAESLPVGDLREFAAIEELKRLATSESEKIFAARYANERDAVRKKELLDANGKTEDVLGKQLESLEKEILAVPAATYDRAKQEAARANLSGLGNQLTVIEVRSENLTPVLKNAAENIRGKIAKANQTLEQHAKESTAIEAITNAFDASGVNLEAFGTRLLVSSAVFPDARREAFESASAECKTWNLVLSWNKALNSADADYLLLKDPSAAEKRGTLFAEWLKQSLDLLQKEQSPVPLTLVNDYVAALNATALGPKSIEEIRDLFSREDIRGLYFVRSTDGKMYYMKDDPTEQVDKAKRMFERGIDAAVISFKHLGGTGIFMKYKDYSEHGRAPQSEIAGEVFSDLHMAQTAGIDVTATKIVERIRDRRNLDPLLAVILMLKVMESAAKADTALEAVLKEPTKLINDAKKSGVDLSVPWLDPDRPDAKRARDAAKKFLETFPNLKMTPEAVKKRHDALEKQLKLSRHQFAGWLCQDPEMGWKVVPLQPSREPAKEKRDLKVLHFQGDAVARWYVIGYRTNGAVTLYSSDRTAFVDGRLVFVAGE